LPPTVDGSDGMVPTQSRECSGEIVLMTLSRMASYARR
jgi:hypothetical protein